MIFDEETGKLYDYRRVASYTFSNLLDAMLSMSVGDILEYKCSDGSIIKGVATKDSGCEECPFKESMSCFTLPCNDKIKFRNITKEDEIKIIKSKTIKLEDIIGRVCNSDVCIYYSNECVQGHSSNKSCLINIIIENTR